MRLPEPLEKLQEMKHAKILGILVTFILDFILVLLVLYVITDYYTGSYLMMFGMTGITFVVPYLFGWRDAKKMVVIGIAMFFLVGAISGPLALHYIYSSEPGEPASSLSHDYWYTQDFEKLENGTYNNDTGVRYSLAEGNVDIYKGDPGATYTFTVTVFSSENFTYLDKPFRVEMGYQIEIWGYDGDSFEMAQSDPNDNNYWDGKQFYIAVPIEDKGVYSHWYAIVFGSGRETHSVNTSFAHQGPLVGSMADNLPLYIAMGGVSMFCSVGLLFLIIVLLYWWLRVAKEKRTTWEKALREKEDEAVAETTVADAKDDALEEKKPFTCDQCGAGVGEEDNFCPKCGERFDGEAAEPEKAKEGAGEKPAE